MSKGPKVWARFEGKQKDGSLIRLRIEDFPEERQDDEAFEFTKKYFMRDEAFHVAAGIYKNEESVKEYRELLNYNYKEHPRTVYCRLDDDSSKPEIIGLSMMIIAYGSENVREKYEQLQSKLKTEELKRFFGLLTVIEEWCGPKDFETFYQGRGIIVDPKYRGLGIANEFVRVRRLICIDEDIPVTIAWMTAIGTQRAAEKNKWKTIKEICTEELGKRSGLDFGNKVPTFKLMYTTRE